MAKRMEKFREMDRNELEIRERELGEQIFRLRFQLTTGQSESVKKLREARRDLARVKTLVRQQDLGKEPLSPNGAEQARKSGGKQDAKAKSAKE